MQQEHRDTHVALPALAAVNVLCMQDLEIFQAVAAQAVWYQVDKIALQTEALVLQVM